MKELTYKEWKLEGYQVNTGQKSIRRNDHGQPLFTEDQVSKSSSSQVKSPKEKKLTYKTYNEWIASGYHIIKGEKAIAKNNNGEYLFSEKQIAVTNKRRFAFREYDYEFCREMDQDYGMDGW